MERLTEWFYDHWGTRTERLNGKLVGTQTCLDKLAEYENLEEQGLLKVFPCKSGDTVWSLVPGNKKKYFQTKITGIQIYTNTIWICYGSYGNERTCPIDEIGKSVFLTEEAAKEKIKTLS